MPQPVGPALTTFAARLRARVRGRPLSSLVFVEIFAGTAALTAAVRRIGLGDSFGVDMHVRRAVLGPLLRLDLSNPAGRDALEAILRLDSVVAIHLAPPCNTASRARDRRRRAGPDPPQLRSDLFPDGLPSLPAASQSLVDAANDLYAYSAWLFQFCFHAGILPSAENPGRSYLWQTSQWAPVRALPDLVCTFWHHCMFGSGRDKYTQLQHLGTHLQGLGKLCSKDHVHAPWGRDPATGVWASASNSAYPPQLCRAWPECLSAELLHHGAQPRPRDLQGLDVHPVSAAAQAAAAQRQPRSKRLPPLVPEFKLMVTLVGPASTLALPAKLPEAVSLPLQVKSSPPVALLPKGSRRLALTLPLGDVGQSELDRAGLEAQSAPPFPMSASLSDDQARALLNVLGEACSEDLSSRRPGVSESGTKGSRYFVFGAYNHGSRSGLTAYTKGREKAVGVINSFAKALLPHATWTSIAVSHNELALPHRDVSNGEGSLNHSMTLGSFTAGRLFLAGGGGDDLLSDAAGVEHRGFYVDNHARFATFDARSVLHATEEWQGDRWAVVLYTCKDPRFDKSHLDTLCGMGFQPPSHWSHPVGAEPGSAASAVYGLPWSPKEFVEEAAAREHPLQACVVPLCVKEAIDKEARCSPHSLAQDRTEVLRKWTLRAQELLDSERRLHESMPAHVSVVLQGKRLLLLKEMLQDAGYCDVGIVDQIASGFDLMGHIPEAGVFRSKTVPATLTPDEVRRTAKHTRQGILLGAAEGLRDEHASRLYEITLEERDKGWLQGPVDPSTLDDRASVSRRFAVFQSGKVRPIDDLSESLINSTTSRTEAVTPHGLDTICRSLTWRFQHRATVPVPNNPVLKSKDLRKAFKQLALSSEGALDGYLCVGNPATGKVEVFSSSVLPFGGSASVTAFCRTSHALWYAGTVLLWLHWSVYFDDYLVTCEASVSKHCDLVLSSFFALLGWGISLGL